MQMQERTQRFIAAYRNRNAHQYLGEPDALRRAAHTDEERAEHARWVAVFHGYMARDYARALPAFWQAFDMASGLPVIQAEILCDLTYIAHMVADVVAGQKAVRAFRRLTRRESAARAYQGRILNNLALLDDLAGDTRSALERSNAALAFYEAPNCPDPDPVCHYGTALQDGALWLRKLGRLYDAQLRLERAYAVMPKDRKAAVAAFLVLVLVEQRQDGTKWADAARQDRDASRLPHYVDAVLSMAEAVGAANAGLGDVFQAAVEAATEQARIAGSTWLSHEVAALRRWVAA